MKRIVSATLAISLIFGGTIAALPFILSSETIKNQIITNFEELTGRDVTFDGEAILSFQPFMTIEVNNFAVNDPKAIDEKTPLFIAEKIQARLNILPAIFGKVSVSQYQLIRPRLNLKTYQDGFSNWKFNDGSISKFLASEPPNVTDQATPPLLGQLTINDGQINIDDMISGRTERITNLDGELSAPNISSNLNAKGSAIWRGEAINFDAQIEDMKNLISGNGSKARLELQSPPINFNFDGQSNTIAGLFVTGKFSASSPSLQRFSDFVNVDFGGLRNTANWNLQGSIEGTFDSAKITDAILGFHENEATGALNFALDQASQARIDGTLAFDEIDALTLFPETDNQETQPIAPNSLTLDLRISANTIKLGQTMISNVAGTINVDENNSSFDIGYSEAFGGTMVATISSEHSDEKSTFALKMTARNLISEDMLADAVNTNASLSGLLDLDAELNGKAIEGAPLLSNVNGSINLSIAEGNIIGIDLPKLLHSNEKQSNVRPDSGITSFDTFDVGLFVNEGIASISKAHIRSGENGIQMIGEINLSSQGIALRAQNLSNDGLPDTKPLFIGGTLTAPLFSIKPSIDSGDVSPAQKNQEQETNRSLQNN